MTSLFISEFQQKEVKCVSSLLHEHYQSKVWFGQPKMNSFIIWVPTKMQRMSVLTIQSNEYSVDENISVKLSYFLFIYQSTTKDFFRQCLQPISKLMSCYFGETLIMLSHGKLYLLVRRNLVKVSSQKNGRSRVPRIREP